MRLFCGHFLHGLSGRNSPPNLVAVATTTAPACWGGDAVESCFLILSAWNLIGGEQFVIDANQFVILKIQAQVLREHVLATGFEAKRVVPTLGVKRVTEHGTAKDEEYLL